MRNRLRRVDERRIVVEIPLAGQDQPIWPLTMPATSSVPVAAMFQNQLKAPDMKMSMSTMIETSTASAPDDSAPRQAAANS